MKGWKRTNGWIGPFGERRRTGISWIGHRERRGRCQSKPIQGFFGRSVKIQHLPAANETNGVGPLSRRGAAVETNNVVGHRDEFLVQFGTESIELSKIQGPKIEKEVPINQLCVDTKVVYLFLLAVCITAVTYFLGRPALERHKVESVLKNYNCIPVLC